MYYNYDYKNHECEEVEDVVNKHGFIETVVSTGFKLMKMGIGVVLISCGVRMVNNTYNDLTNLNLKN